MPNIVSRPNGERVWGVIVCSSLAWILSISATGQCSFMHRDVKLAATPITPIPLLYEGRGVGFWGWEHKNGNCYSYTIGGKTPSFDGAYGAARAFTGLCDAVGGMAMVCAWMTSCFRAEKKHFRVLGVVFIVVAFLEMLSLIVMSSSVCKDAGFFAYGLDDNALNGDDLSDLLEGVESSCGLATGASLAVSSSVFWFLSSIASRLVKPPKDDDGTIDMQTLEPLDTPRNDRDRDSVKDFNEDRDDGDEDDDEDDEDDGDDRRGEIDDGWE